MPTSLESQHRELRKKDAPGQLDPDVVIPPAVKALAAKADEAHRKAYPEATPPAPTADAAPTDGEQPPVKDAPAGGSETSSPEAEPPVPTPPPQVTEMDWEHRYKSMQGRYDRAQESMRAMQDQILNLQNVLATMNTPVNRDTPHELRPESLLSPEEVNEYGAEFLDVVGKKAREAYAPVVQGLQDEITQLKQQLGQVGGHLASDARGRMFSILDQEVPNWRAININPKFLEWLRLTDQYSGAIRHQLLEAAWSRNDTARSLAFFKGFLADEAADDPANRGQPNGSQLPAPGGKPPNGKVPLEQFAAPGRARTAAEIPAEKPTITRAQIATFYANCTAGKYRGDEAEKMRLEKMIFDAQAEGRIVN